MRCDQVLLAIFHARAILFDRENAGGNQRHGFGEKSRFKALRFDPREAPSYKIRFLFGIAFRVF